MGLTSFILVNILFWLVYFTIISSDSSSDISFFFALLGIIIVFFGIFVGFTQLFII